MRIKMPAVRIAQDSDSAEGDSAAPDILTCGACQKTFALSDIVKFIQHKVLQCNKENYGQCSTQGGSNDREAEDGRPLSLVNRRPSISAPITNRKPSGSRIHTPPPSPADLLADGASSTPKRLVDENDNTTPKEDASTALSTHNSNKECNERLQNASSESCDNDGQADISKVVNIKQERELDDAEAEGDAEGNVEASTCLNESNQANNNNNDDDNGDNNDDQPLSKRPKIEVVDAEANTMHTEPSNYTCSTCKTRYGSAWRLIQHVQHSHGVKIYVEFPTSSSNALAQSMPPTSALSPSSNLASTSAATGSSLSNSLSMSLLHNAQKANLSNASSMGSSLCSTTSPMSAGSNQSGSQQQLHQQLQQQQQQRAAAAAEHHKQQQQQQQQNSLTTAMQNAQNLAAAAAAGMRHHALLPPLDMHTNPFNLLRMPLPPALTQGAVVSGVPPLFSRPHPDHYRMEQLVSEQFRHHGLNLAAAAAAAQFSQSSSVTPGPNNAEQRPPSTSSSHRGSVPPPSLPLPLPPPSSSAPTPVSTPISAASQAPANLNLEPQMDFYSQRLRQLAGTTSPGAGNIVNSSSPSPRQKQSPHFASPSPSQLPPTPLTKNTRPHSLTPPEKSDINNGESTGISLTPRSASTPPTKLSQENITPAIYSCSQCDKKFRVESNLLLHERRHTGEKLYKCTACEFDCSHIDKLTRHMRVHHNLEDGVSNAGSVETNEDLESEPEDENMGTEDGMDEDDEEDGDDGEEIDYEAEDLSVSTRIDAKSESPKPPTSGPTSLVGELMDKFGLSNIAQYSEAYKQALQESGNLKHLANKDHDNNNSTSSSSPMPPVSDKLNGLPAALRLRDEFAKNMFQQQGQAPEHQAPPPQMPLFNPFQNPFEISKQMKMEGNWWNMSALHRNDALFENLKLKPLGLGSANSLLHNTVLKKDARQRNDTCEYCGKVFKNCSNLTVHRRSHTGEKPYKCELCSYACAQSSKLTRHMKTHGRTGKDVYRCRFCDMPFSVPSTLEKHMRKCVVNKGKAAANAIAVAQAAAQQLHAQQQLSPQFPPQFAGMGNCNNMSLPSSVSGDNDSNTCMSLPPHPVSLKEEA